MLVGDLNVTERHQAKSWEGRVSCLKAPAHATHIVAAQRMLLVADPCPLPDYVHSSWQPYKIGTVA